jgi:hypothetical protein
MQCAYLLAALGIPLSAAPPMAQEAKPAAPPASAREWTDPVVESHHRQPTETEVEARERAEGESAKAIQERNRKEDHVIDDLYKELMTPVPLNERSGQ